MQGRSADYTDVKWNVTVSVQQIACDLDIAYGNKTLSGAVLSDSVTVATFSSSGQLQSSGDIKFADGGLWIKKHAPSECNYIQGYYVDAYQQKNIIVTQVGCDVELDYGGEALQGGVLNDVVTIYSFKAAGHVQLTGDVQFEDGGLWSKLPSHCVDISGDYMDNKWNKAVSVSQTQCDVAVSYGGKRLTGSVFGPRVSVESFDADGSVQDNRDIAFDDGGLWERQPLVV